MKSNSKKCCTIGIDPSIRGFCALALESPDITHSVITLTSLPGLSEIIRLQRLSIAFKNWLRLQATIFPINMVTIEEVAWASRSRSIVTLGKLQGTILGTCFDLKIPIVTIPIQTIKIFATGKGNAKPEEVLKAAELRHPSPVKLSKDWAVAYFIALFTQTQLMGNYAANRKFKSGVIGQFPDRTIGCREECFGGTKNSKRSPRISG